MNQSTEGSAILTHYHNLLKSEFEPIFQKILGNRYEWGKIRTRPNDPYGYFYVHFWHIDDTCRSELFESWVEISIENEIFYVHNDPEAPLGTHLSDPDLEQKIREDFEEIVYRELDETLKEIENKKKLLLESSNSFTDLMDKLNENRRNHRKRDPASVPA